MAAKAMAAVAAVAMLVGIAGANEALLWPKPLSYRTTGETTLTLTRGEFGFVATGATSEVLDAAFARTLDLIFPAGQDAQRGALQGDGGQAGVRRVELAELQVMVNSTDVGLRSGVNENYTLTLSDTGASTLVAPTVWGALHGLETFYQLALLASADQAAITNVPLVISDAPRFSHRGLLVDSSRNFLTLDALRRTIDGLAATKMNVLHWHIVDSQSFPIEVPGFPLMTEGAYSASEIYTPADLEGLVRYAYLRGVRIMPEFDSPGHAYSWGVGYPEITVCPNLTPYLLYCLQPPCGQLNPSSEQTYTVVRGVLNHALNVFSDDFLHLGFDEVNDRCWETSPELQAWMVEQGIPDGRGLLQYHVDRLLQITDGQRRPVFWQEAYDEGLALPANAVFQIWNRPESLSAILRAGYNAISSPADELYLDCGSGNFISVLGGCTALSLWATTTRVAREAGGDRSWCAYNNWRTVYMHEPVPEDLADEPEAAARLLGGEVCLWGEIVDSVSIDGLAWPRTAAAGERLWSTADTRDVSEAVFRFERHRDRLVARGIRARVIRPKFCQLHPGTCDLDGR